MATKRKPTKPVHPGQLLWKELMQPLDLTTRQLAKDLGVTTPRVTAVVKGKRGIDAELALRLGRYFGTIAEVWVGLQAAHDLALARQKLGKQIERKVKRHA